MKKLTLLIGSLLLAGPVLAQDCDRDCLRGSTAGTHVLAMENGNPVLVAIRLKIEGGKVSEAETTVVRNREEGMNFGPGSLMRGEGELSVWEMFKIYDGRIQAIEAFMEEVPPGTPFGWTY